MRRRVIAIPLGLVLALATAPSLAADQSVRATSSSTFSPSTVTIDVGDTVTWSNDGGIHNVRFDDGSFEEPSEPSFASWTASRRFTAPGTFRYFCEAHGQSGGRGMSGTVVVRGAQEPPPGGEPSDTTPPDIDSLRVAPSTFCNRKTKRCRKVGAQIRFTLSEAASVTGRVIRRRDGKRIRSLKIDGKAGSNRVKYSGKGLALGKYRLELTPRDAAGNRAAKPSRANFTVATRR